MIDFKEILKKRIVYEIPGMEQARVAENRVYKTVMNSRINVGACI